MPTTFGIGFSDDKNGNKAAMEAAEQAKKPFEDRSIDFAILLITEKYDPREVLPAVIKILGTKNIIGCTATAIIHDTAIEKNGVSMICVRSGEMFSILQATASMNTLTAMQEGARFAEKCFQPSIDFQRQVMITLVDGLLQDKFRFVQGLQSGISEFFSVIGAGSCDNFKFKKSYQICNDSILTQAAVGLLLGGEFPYGIGSRHGWRPLGKPRTIDEADGSIVKTISGKPAVSFYEEFFDHSLAALLGNASLNVDLLYPIGVKIEGSKKYIIRKVIKVYQDGSILCEGNMPVGSEVHMMIGNQEACRQATREAALEAKRHLGDHAAGIVLVFQSIARLKLFGRSLTEDIQEIHDVFGNETPVWGICSHGEIAPFTMQDEEKQIALQNASVVILAIS